jgi:CDP-diglyceride synthetase
MVMTSGTSAGIPAGIIGRTLRLMLGSLFAWTTFTIMRSEDRAFNVRVLAVFGGMLVFYAIAHAVVRRLAPRIHRWYGALLAVAPTVLVFAAGGPIGRVAASAYVGLSLLVQTLRADGGCEVLAVPALVLGGRTHLAGILFAPIDLVEKHLTGPGGLPG